MKNTKKQVWSLSPDAPCCRVSLRKHTKACLA